MTTEDCALGSILSIWPPKQVRRDKRCVPDNDKDDKYWEKRKRNNIAAKKSRDNKRLAESAIRSKVQELEEENALLKKELFIIKKKLNLPLDLCLLTHKERDECLQEMLHDQKYAKLTITPDSSSDRSSSINEDTGYIDLDASQVSAASPNPETPPFCYVLSSQSPPPLNQHTPVVTNGAHNVFKSCYSDPRDILEHIQQSKRLKTDGHSEMAADLSVKRSPVTDDILSDVKSGNVTSRENIIQDSRDLPRVDNSVHQGEDLRDDSEDIKRKLQLLSEQVQKMQKTFNF